MPKCRVTAALLLLLPGCAALTRLPAPPEALVSSLPVTGIGNGRFLADGASPPPVAEALLAASRRVPGAERHFLALSGGGGDGAFGAGLLTGWAGHGDRPSFDVVTGISAGTLIAPSAQRHLIECCFSNLKQFRRVATQYEKTARNYLAVVTRAAIVLWLR
jgi:hypothetical protein